MLQDASLRLEATNLKRNLNKNVIIKKVRTYMILSIKLLAELAMGGASCPFSFC